MIIDAFDSMREDRLIGQIEFSDHSNKTKPLLSHSNTMKTLVILFQLYSISPLLVEKLLSASPEVNWLISIRTVLLFQLS